MKNEIINLILVVVIASMFLMGQEMIPQWLFFESRWVRLSVFILAFMTLFFRAGLWPTGNHEKEQAFRD